VNPTSPTPTLTSAPTTPAPQRTTAQRIARRIGFLRRMAALATRDDVTDGERALHAEYDRELSRLTADYLDDGTLRPNPELDAMAAAEERRLRRIVRAAQRRGVDVNL